MGSHGTNGRIVVLGNGGIRNRICRGILSMCALPHHGTPADTDAIISEHLNQINLAIDPWQMLFPCCSSHRPELEMMQHAEDVRGSGNKVGIVVRNLKVEWYFLTQSNSSTLMPWQSSCLVVWLRSTYSHCWEEQSPPWQMESMRGAERFKLDAGITFILHS